MSIISQQPCKCGFEGWELYLGEKKMSQMIVATIADTADSARQLQA